MRLGLVSLVLMLTALVAVLSSRLPLLLGFLVGMVVVVVVAGLLRGKVAHSLHIMEVETDFAPRQQSARYRAQQLDCTNIQRELVLFRYVVYSFSSFPA